MIQLVWESYNKLVRERGHQYGHTRSILLGPADHNARDIAGFRQQRVLR